MNKSKSKKVNRAWINDHVNDPYVKLAKIEGYRARAAFKLKEIDETCGWSSPASWWSIWVPRPAPGASTCGAGMSPEGAAVGALNGVILALDILPMEPIEGVEFLQGDFREPEFLARFEALVGDRQADLVVSDMAPNLSGIASADTARIAEMVELAVEFARAHMKPQGTLVVKLFHGSGYNELVKLFKDNFKVVKPIKPKASRDKSSERILAGTGIKPGL